MLPNWATAVEMSRTSQHVTFPISSHYHHHHLPPPPLCTAATTAVEPPGECPLLGQARASSSIPLASNTPNNSTMSLVPNPLTMPPMPPIKPPTAPRHCHSTPPQIPPQLHHVTTPQQDQQHPPVPPHCRLPPPNQTTTTTHATSPLKIQAGGNERSREGGIGKDTRGGVGAGGGWAGRQWQLVCRCCFPKFWGAYRTTTILSSSLQVFNNNEGEEAPLEPPHSTPCPACSCGIKNGAVWSLPPPRFSSFNPPSVGGVLFPWHRVQARSRDRGSIESICCPLLVSFPYPPTRGVLYQQWRRWQGGI